MAMIQKKQGFALFVAVIFMSVMLTFGLALGSLAYKQQVLASSSVDSQYAFYAADAGLECLLYADQQKASFSPYPASDPGVGGTPALDCDGNSVVASATAWSATRWSMTYRVALDASSAHPRCADVTVYKYKVPQSNGATSYLFSQGYNISCAAVATEGSDPNARFSSRGLSAHY